MDSKKRMMFNIDDDYYYITIKLIIILIQLDCFRNRFSDYRKLAYIILFIKSNESINLFNRSIEEYDNLSIFEREQLISIYYKGCVYQPIIKRVLFFLEKKQIIILEKNTKYACIDIKLSRDKNIKNIFLSDKFDDDIEKVNRLYKQYNRIRTVKYDTFIKRVFGDSEVSKWEC